MKPGGHIARLSLSRGGCKWPVYASGRLTLFCGQPATAAPCCEDHAERPIFCGGEAMSSIPNGKHVQWAPAMDESLMKMRARGDSYRVCAIEIGRIFGQVITTSAVVYRIQTLRGEQAAYARSRAKAKARASAIPPGLAQTGLRCRKSFSTGPCANICMGCAEYKIPVPSSASIRRNREAGMIA